MAGSCHNDVELYAKAIQLSGEEQIAFLNSACGDDIDQRRRMEALLRSNARVGKFLEEPPTVSIAGSRAKMMAGEKPGDWVGRYKLLKEIGEGGCGVVFLAEQENPVRRRVALKVVKPGMDTRRVIGRFEAERQALALMDHPSIAKIFDAGETESGRPYFVMELVRGTKITSYCDEHALTIEERLKLFVQVCQAVQHAHQKGVIHRDIKPSNVLVSTTEEGASLPVVIDFGIAKATADRQLTDETLLTEIEMFLGTPAYMSPEQATLGGAEVDTRTDIYSLGVLLYELLAGSTPFDTRELLKRDLDQVRRHIREEEPIRPSTRLGRLMDADLTSVARRRQSEAPALIRAVRGDLDWIVMKALEKERGRRYQTANGLALDIQRYLANEAISARPPSKVYRLQKTILRNKLLFASGAMVALLLVVSLVVVSISLARERKAFAKSEEITKFFKSMLSGVGYSVARDRDTTMLREILDQTAGNIGKEMSAHPEVEGELRLIMGRLYGDIHRYEQAEAMARKAVAIQRKEFGVESLQAAEALELLGGQLLAQQELAEAERAQNEALTIRKERLGMNSTNTASSLNQLAEVYREQRRLKEANAIALEGLRIRQMIKTNSLDVADSLRNLCMIQGYGGRWEEAEKTAREVLAMRRGLLGSEDPLIASALEDLAWAVGGLDKLEEAESLISEALAMRRNLSGDTHPDVPRNLNALGQLLGKRGNGQAAEAVLEAVLSVQLKILGEDNKATLETFCSLGKALRDGGKRAEAEMMFRKALAVWDARGEPDKPDRLYALRELGETLEGQGRWSEAEGLWRESLALWRKLGGIEEQQSMYTLRRLGVNLECARKWPETEVIFREALSISRKKGDEDPEALVDLDRVARALMAQKKLSEAEQLLDEALTPAFVKKPGSVNLLVLKVNIMGRQGRWREAASSAALALENQLTEHYRYHTLVALLAMLGDRPAYEDICKKLVAKFADANNPYVAERIVQDYLLLPNTGADLILMDKLADKAVTLGGDTDDLPYFQACKGMSLYRLGNFSEAIGWASKAAESSNDFAQAKAFAILSMANWQLGRTDQALAAFGRGDRLAPVSSRETSDDLGESWVAWLMARISLDEAAGLIRGGDQSLQP
jgi:eukaryotic-like serine/threonine-protein kinase